LPVENYEQFKAIWESSNQLKFIKALKKKYSGGYVGIDLSEEKEMKTEGYQFKTVDTRNEISQCAEALPMPETVDDMPTLSPLKDVNPMIF
jgi:hypothetical protein